MSQIGIATSFTAFITKALNFLSDFTIPAYLKFKSYFVRDLERLWSEVIIVFYTLLQHFHNPSPKM